MFTIAIKNAKAHQQQTFSCDRLDVIGAEKLSCGWQLSLLEQGEIPQEVTANQPAMRVELAGQSPRELGFSLKLVGGDSSKLKLTNFGKSIALSHGPRIHRGRTVDLSLPVSFCIGQTQVQVMDHLPQRPIDDGLTSVSQKISLSRETQVSPGPETLAAWLETLSDLQKVAAGTQELFDLATQAIFNPGGLDGCLLLSRTENGWQIDSSHLPYPDNGISFREELVQAAYESGETLYHDATIVDVQERLDDLHTAVVCPVLGPDEAIAKVLYGFRSLHRRNSRKGIRFLEAQFVQVVADSLSAGMIRLTTEAEAARTIVLLEQAFPARIARELIQGKQVLEPKSEEVTVLFADVRGFSSIAERVGAAVTFEFLRDVMDQMSCAITDLDGVIIDFFGDGISAFWNAPVPQPEHALLACQAGVEILESLPALNQRWSKKLGCPIRFGIGIHTGSAMIGNSGSRSRLKYGPQGMTVNLASRLEGWTKKLNVPLLMSHATEQRLAGVFPTRKLSTIQPKGHQAEMDVYTLETLLPNELPMTDVAASKDESVPERKLTGHHSTFSLQ